MIWKEKENLLRLRKIENIFRWSYWLKMKTCVNDVLMFDDLQAARSKVYIRKRIDCEQVTFIGGMFVFNQTIELLWILTLNIFIIYSWWVCFLSLFFNHTLYNNTSMKGMKPLVPALHHIVSNLDKMPCHWHAKKLDQGKRSRMCIWVNHSSINILCVQAIYFK